MVFLLLNPMDLEAVLSVAQASNSSVWLGSDAVTEQQVKELWAIGHRLSRFNYPLAAESQEVISDALTTIREHHPGEVIWVQYATQL